MDTLLPTAPSKPGSSAQTGADGTILSPATLPDWADWWTEGRAAAWESFQNLPMPKRKDEDWRFANVRALKLEGFRPAPPADPALLRPSTTLPAFPLAARVVFANDQVVEFHPLPEELQRQGVIWESLETAVCKHGDLVRRHFMTSDFPLGSAKFAALHRAWCRAGSVLIIPKNVHITLPIAAYHQLSGEGSAIFPHTLVIAGENSSATFIDFFNSLDQAQGFVCGIKDLILAPGAKVDYLSVQEWNEKTLAFHLNSTTVDRQASGKYLNVHLGGGFIRTESHSRLTGEGGRSDMLAVAVGHDHQEIDLRTLQSHCAPHTTSDLLYKNTLNHRAKAVFQGLIRVDPGARWTDAYQTNRNLLLDPEAEADSMPGLEILNDDVKCSHGATTGQIDPEELFYLLSRGINAHQARHLLAIGFFEEVLERFGHAGISAYLRERIVSKFDRSESIRTETVVEGDIDPTQVRVLQGTE
ncbi:MAG: Fe-S cluster assembly protein SufD [Candidatus Methylacidiphilales bacterium]|nr:Fe-S cluster assembly protein SufD [Candidatus Methylacidiphilales bacterium]